MSEMSGSNVKVKTSCLVFVGKGIVAPYILEDVVLALTSLGCEVELESLGVRGDDLDLKIQNLKPDFIFSLDGTGLEDSSVQKSPALKVAWFVDNPFYFSVTDTLGKEDFLFVWDKEYVLDLKEEGFQNVFFLPLATNPDRFFEETLSEKEMNDYKCDVSFVGTFGMTPEALKRDREGKYPPELNRLIDKLIKAGQYLYHPKGSEEYLKVLSQTYSALDKMARPLVDMLTDWELDSTRRQEILKVVGEFNAKLFGPEKLRDFSTKKADYLGVADYKNRLRKIYQTSQININSTRPQLRTTVNQRVFDVFSSGGFLLTDYRSLLEEVLPFKAETISFFSADELREKIEYFLGHEDERQNLTRLAQAEIREKHTYRVRMEEMLGILAKHF